MKIANCRAHYSVEKKEVFKGSNLFSEKLRKGYVVYSYGHHFPLFVYSEITQRWYMNMTKRSVTTRKHRSQAHPGKYCEELNLQEMKKLVSELS